MEDEKLHRIMKELSAVFDKHEVNEVTQRVGILGAMQTITVLSGSVEAMAKCLERHSALKAAKEP